MRLAELVMVVRVFVRVACWFHLLDLLYSTTRQWVDSNKNLPTAVVAKEGEEKTESRVYICTI